VEKNMLRLKLKNLVLTGIILTAGLYGKGLKVEHFDIPYKGEERVDVEIQFNLGELKLKNAEDDKYIFKAEIIYDKDKYKPIVEFRRSGKTGKLTLSSEKRNGDSFFGRGRGSSSGGIDDNKWDTEFIGIIPITFDIELGLGKGKLDFTDMLITDIQLMTGLSDVIAEFNGANREIIRTLTLETGLGNVEFYGLGYANIERLSIECGLGSAQLSFDGEIQRDIKGKISVGLGSVNIKIPKDVGVRIKAESSFLSSLDIKNFYQVGPSRYESENWDDAKHKIYLTVEVGLGSVDIDWIK
jgi:hypothetical protein